MSRLLTPILAALALYWVSGFVGSTDYYLRLANPDQYWSNKVERLELRLDTAQRQIQDSELHIQQLEAMKPTTAARARVWGSSPSEVAEEVGQLDALIRYERQIIRQNEDAAERYKMRLMDALERR
jgi:hypothetical protein